MAQAPAPSPSEPPRRRRRLTRAPRPSGRPELDDGARPLPAAPPRRAATEHEALRGGYRGQPITKAPVWTWEVPLYFFVGGVAGGLSLIALAGMLMGAPRALLLTALWVSSSGAVIAPVLLISDLKRPKRFLYMLRVFKWRSPLSVGAWILSGFGPAVVVATLAYSFAPAIAADAGWVAGLMRVVVWVSLVPAALLGALLTTYTAVLIGATTVPAWAARRKILPLHFGVAGLGSAAALLELFFRLPSLWALVAVAALVETGVAVWLEVKRPGSERRDAPLREGHGGRLLRIAGLLTGPVSLAFRLVGWIGPSDVSFLVGALVSRFGWMAAGRASAADPSATVEQAR